MNPKTDMAFCPHTSIERTRRAYKCKDCQMPVVIHGVPMTIQQVTAFEKMRRENAAKYRRRTTTGLILPNEVSLNRGGE